MLSVGEIPRRPSKLSSSHPKNIFFRFRVRYLWHNTKKVKPIELLSLNVW